MGPHRRNRSALPAAVLWDMDGTLVDTEQHWIAAEMELTAAHGAHWTHDDALEAVGSALPDAAAKLQARGVALPAERIIEELLTVVAAKVVDAMPWQVGALELLEELAQEGVPCALVTMSYKPLADLIVQAAPPGVFGSVVTGDRVTAGKPHPEPYRLAVAELDVDIVRCVAVEDSPSGLASAHAAGARVLGVPHVVPVAAAPERSRMPSLAGVTLGHLERIAAGEVIDMLDNPVGEARRDP